MAREIPLKDLLDILLGMPGTFILRNAHGSMELRGNDLYLHPYKEWLTVYHTTTENPESRSHLHLRWQTLRAAVVIRDAGETPHVAFYANPEASGEPPLIWYFPSFYDWQRGKAEIPANIARYEAFVQAHGTVLRLIDPTTE